MKEKQKQKYKRLSDHKKITESDMVLIGLILLGLIVIVYLNNTRHAINENNLTEIKGELSKEPKLITWGGDMPTYEIEFTLKNNDKEYSLVNCGYDLVNENFN